MTLFMGSGLWQGGHWQGGLELGAPTAFSVLGESSDRLAELTSASPSFALGCSSQWLGTECRPVHIVIDGGALAIPARLRLSRTRARSSSSMARHGRRPLAGRPLAGRARARRSYGLWRPRRVQRSARRAPDVRKLRGEPSVSPEALLPTRPTAGSRAKPKPRTEGLRAQATTTRATTRPGPGTTWS